MTTAVDTFQSTYNRLDSRSLFLLDELYAGDVVFKDPLHEIHGLPALREYLARLYTDVVRCTFTFEDQVVHADRAMLTWTMHLEHARFCKGQVLHLPGASHIRFTAKIVYHCDYFDVGAFLYERVPLLGPVVRAIKRRL